MELSSEIENALIIVAGIWAAELKDIDPGDREFAINKWIERHQINYHHLRDHFEDRKLPEDHH